jgi:hypothetical protein
VKLALNCTAAQTDRCQFGYSNSGRDSGFNHIEPQILSTT